MLRRLILIDRGRARKGSLETLLKDDFDLQICPSVDQAIPEIHHLRPHGIIVIDDEQPADILQALRGDESCKELPMIVVGSGSSRSKEVAAFEAGADDFITKESDPAVLKARVLGILRQSYLVKKLESKLDEMDSFVKTVTHDLKNPIGSILSCSELLRGSLEAGNIAEVRELSETIQKSSEHALEFIQDLLVLLRNGAQLREVGEVPVREIIDASLKELEVKIRATGAVVEVPDEMPAIPCDRRRMVQVFTNIISNALKYVDKGVRPVIKISSIENPHAHTFVVGDNGIGMDYKDTKKIFQPFVRLPSAAETEGTGLGLSIVQRIIDAHEGDVFAVSRKGLGSEFFIVLPTQLSLMPQTA